jgi:hypothetical protein
MPLGTLTFIGPQLADIVFQYAVLSPERSSLGVQVLFSLGLGTIFTRIYIFADMFPAPYYCSYIYLIFVFRLAIATRESYTSGLIFLLLSASSAIKQIY